jgi:hypothetical protein
MRQIFLAISDLALIFEMALRILRDHDAVSRA